MWWDRTQPEKAAAESFVTALNAHDAAAVESLLTEDFTYIDSFREGVSGRGRVMKALRSLLASDPDYGMEVERIDWRKPHILMSGKVRSRLFGSGRRAVWQVTMRRQKLAELQIWSEGGPPPLSRILSPVVVEDMMGRAAEPPPLSNRL